MAFTRPVVGTDISAADFGQPVYDMIQPTAWTNVTFQNSWRNYDAPRACQYRRVGDMVQLRGLMTGGAINAAAFTLPAGFFHPARIVSMVVDSGLALGILSITNSGVVTPNVGVSSYVSLDNINYPITP